jgi:hypothetical protein
MEAFSSNTDGGSNQSLVLTPISVQGQVGIGFALGISAMELSRA